MCALVGVQLKYSCILSTDSVEWGGGGVDGFFAKNPNKMLFIQAGAL